MKGTSKLLSAVIVVVIVGVGGWIAWNTQSETGLGSISPDTKLSDAQVNYLVGRISQFMVVPQGEEPSITVLGDIQELAADQSFYQDAKDGDLLVVFSNRAIIYDPVSDKLVTVSSIDRLEEENPEASPTPSGTPLAPEKVTVDVLNGTTTAGLAGSTASDLKKNDWVTIGKVSDAKGSYTSTLVVDLSGGKNPGALAALEAEFGVTAVTVLPSGEQSSTANIVVILGK